jgi:hypothetical protein
MTAIVRTGRLTTDERRRIEEKCSRTMDEGRVP